MLEIPPKGQYHPTAMSSSRLTPGPINVGIRKLDGKLAIQFDDDLVAKTASDHIIQLSALTRFDVSEPNRDLILEIWNQINGTIIHLQKTGVLVWDAFTQKWEIYDGSSVAHLQEGRA